MRQRGFKHTEYTKNRIAEATRGRVVSRETRRKHSETLKLKGHHLNEDAKLNLSTKLKGRTVSSETRKKMSESSKAERNSNYGKHLPQATRQKISEATKGEKSCHWKGGKIKAFCDTCGQEIFDYPSHIKRTKSHHCSNRCASIYRMKHMNTKNTSIEIAIEVELLKQAIPYMKQVPLEGITLADFLLPNKVVIQCDGDYWHSTRERKDRDANQDFILNFRGYKVYRFREMEIKKSPSRCVNKIFKDLGGAT